LTVWRIDRTRNEVKNMSEILSATLS